ncbi:hypothetical protein [Marinobacter oulmenensis]|uniref:Uncharacterized protein n=1 Tax=Marinobacter oulmenensis TaxID=643747 RepID=A0A840UDR8_9GAMM|nr:hypothetical protein [Marinobacter oulmenensis]MBB5322343.1 hypothetical protein [Marinobacter oulmenensis]
MGYRPPERTAPVTLTVGYKAPGLYHPRVLTENYQPPALGEPQCLPEQYQAPNIADGLTLLTPYSPPAFAPIALDTRYIALAGFEPVTLYTPYQPLALGKPIVITEGYKALDLGQPRVLATDYTPPAITARVTIVDPYAPPERSLPLVLTNGITDESDEPDAEGRLLADLPRPVPAITFAAFGAQDTTYNPPPLLSAVVLRVGYIALPLDNHVELSEQIEPESSTYGNLRADTPAPRFSLTATGTGETIAAGALAAQLPATNPPVALTSEAVQNLDLPDNDGTSTRTRHGTRYPDAWQGLAFRQHHGQPMALLLQADNQAMEQRRNSLAAPQAEMIRFQRPIRQGHQHGIDAGSHIQAPYAEAIRTRASQQERHQHGIDRHGNSGLPHADTIKRRPSVRLAEQQAQPAGRGLGIGNREAWPAGTRLEVRWTKADHPAPGYWWPIYQPPGLQVVMPTDDYQPPALRCPVLLGKGYPQQPYCPPEPEQPTIIIPIREEYRVINDFSITELDGTPLSAEDFSASIDADSWTWSWNTRIPASAMPQVRPDTTTRVELIATINGEPLRLVVENIQRERKFGESWLRVSGRGRAALLADPVAPVIQYTNDTALTAQQALAEALQDNGVPIGWNLDWQIEDWQIPAGIWSHNGTWIDAAKRIAEAGGGYVQAHDTDQTLQILPRYPTAPWAWDSATPAISLPEDVVEVEGIDWQEKPAYNAVWVHGGEQGRADRIIIGSTGGTNPAPTIVDELATDPAMTRQRGLALLGDTGKQANISLRLPVLPETGLIRPGALIEYHEQGNTRRGLVRSLSVRHNWPELWQTIGVETHE